MPGISPGVLAVKEKTIKLPVDLEVQRGIIKDLAAAVIIQALRDLKNWRYELQLDAALWLAGSDLPLWLAAALDDDPEGLTNAGINALTSGRINELIKKVKKQ